MFTDKLNNDLNIIKEIIGKYSETDKRSIEEWLKEEYDTILYGIRGIIDRLYYDEQIMEDSDYNTLRQILDNTDNPYVNEVRKFKNLIIKEVPQQLKPFIGKK